MFMFMALKDIKVTDSTVDHGDLFQEPGELESWGALRWSVVPCRSVSTFQNRDHTKNC